MQTPPYFIADLHCDLLCYLSHGEPNSPYDLPVRCSIPQLKDGNVKLQTLAIFCETSQGSTKKAQKQVDVFCQLTKKYPDVFEAVHQAHQLENRETSNKIGIVPAIENASAICEEDENLDPALQRFTIMQKKMGKVAYVSLTWNTENRFGGGAYSKVGLKEDGKRLIEYLSQKEIALDFSHTSDYLAFDMLNYIDKTNLKLPIIASHSNLRSIVDVPRNLPDELAKEILRRGGLIGLNFIRSFVGHDSPQNFIKHYEHLLSLGGEKQVCFGADFFHDSDLPPAYRSSPEGSFFPAYDHAGTYGKVLDMWRQYLGTHEEALKLVSHKNLIKFLKEKIYKDMP